MSRESTLVLFGTLIILAPFSGLPLSWLQWLLPALGIIIAGIGYTLRARRRRPALGGTLTEV